LISDLYHYWGGDLITDNTGDVALSNGTLLGQQRLLRRLLTNPGDYLFHPNYGAGLAQYIGQTIDLRKVRALILAQMLLEDVVAKIPPPQISVTQNATDSTAFNVSILYNDATTRQPVTLSFNVSN
jgi:hypothetical protein